MKKLFIAFLIVASMTGTAHATVGADCKQDSSACDSYSETCDLQTFKCVSLGDSGVLQPTTTQPSDSGSNSGSSFVPLAPIPGLTQGAVANPQGLANFINNLYKYLIGLAAIIAIIQIIWAGIDIAFFHKDAVSAITDDKGKIYNAIFGLVLVLSPVLVFSIINPSILNLSLNLPPLDTASAPTNAPSVTQNIQLSNTETQLRQSAGAQVLYAFTLPSIESMTPTQILQRINAEQTKCTSATGGPGIIMPVTTSGGGTINYACQTCPPNTSVSLSSSCTRSKTGLIVCGVCQPN